MVVLLSHARHPHGIVTRGRDWHDVFVLAVFRPRVVTSVLGIAGNWLGNRLREVKRVVDHQIKCRPFTDFARWITSVAHLTNEVDDRTGIETAEIVKQARIPAVLRNEPNLGPKNRLSKLSLGDPGSA